MSSPTLSVLTTAFNRQDYIAECIESVLASSFTDFEYIIVDDNSTDDTLQIAKAYEAQDTRVRVYSNKPNLGDYPNRNRAASFARGTYLKYLDSDDIIYPHGLAVMVEMIQRFPEAGLGLCDHADKHRPHPLNLTPPEAYRRHYFDTGLLGRAPGSAIIRRSAFESVGGFSGSKQIGDHECWLKIAAKFAVVTMPPALAWDRIHGEQEQSYDDANTKAKLHYEVMLAALRADTCPLPMTERLQALSAIRTRHIKQAILPALARCRFSQALSAKAALEISCSELFGALSGRQPDFHGYQSLLGKPTN